VRFPLNLKLFTREPTACCAETSPCALKLEKTENIMHQVTQEMRACIKECLDCYQICLGSAMTHCLETGGQHTEPGHFRLINACAEICRTAAHFMLLNSPLHTRICGECAEICEQCARDCKRLGDMQECVESCRRCAENCRKMAGRKRAA
jgi:hypothetical protein